MKLLLVTSSLLVCAAAAVAQTPTQPDTPAGVTILKISSRSMIRSRDWDTPRDSATNQTVEDPRSLPSRDPNISQSPVPVGSVPMTRARDRTSQTKGPRSGDTQIATNTPPAPNRKVEDYSYEARIKNVGEATITAVAWEYLFLDPASGNQLASHRFRSFRKAEAGKSVTLSGKSIGPPTRVISAAGTDDKRRLFDERVVIKCVAYTDGTVRWLATASESDCADIRSSDRTRRD
jgi:hypothetical protein